MAPKPTTKGPAIMHSLDTPSVTNGNLSHGPSLHAPGHRSVRGRRFSAVATGSYEHGDAAKAVTVSRCRPSLFDQLVQSSAATSSSGN